MRSYSKKKSRRGLTSKKTSIKSKSRRRGTSPRVISSKKSRKEKITSILKETKKRLTKQQCKNHLKDKISINLMEFKEGKFKSRQQAIAVSYSQVKSKYPSCKRYFKKKEE